MSKRIALIPARAGSLRVPSKNIRALCGHPLIAYSIQVAIQSKMFDRVLVSTDSETIQKIAIHYGADAPFLRPAELASSTAIDIQWITHALQQIDSDHDIFSIVRPTSPFRTTEMLMRAIKQFESWKGLDSMRAVELCEQHPGKMWKIRDEDGLLESFLPQGQMEKPWHARQYQDLPKVYIQNSSLEIAWTEVVWRYKSREGKLIAPFITKDYEGFAIDYPHDFLLAESLVERGIAKPISIPVPSFKEFEKDY